MIQLRTFGGVDLKDSVGREILPLLSQPKRLALLIYLALAKNSGFRRRDKLLALFWPELDDVHARGSLRQALTFLRRTLGEGVIVTRGEEEIGVDRTAVQCDATAFAEACAAGAYADAAALYQGDFLDGFYVSEAAPEFQSWIEDERAEFRRSAGVCSWALADVSRAGGDRPNAAAFARRAAAFGPENEGDLARLLRFLDTLGDRAGAINAYEAFSTKLEREYDATPAPETQALIQAIRARSVAAQDDRPARPPPATQPAKTSGEDIPALPAPVDAHRRPAYLAGAALVVIAVVLVVLGSRAKPADPPHATVAVVPFHELGGDRSRQYIADGLTDELITDLARGTELRVINTPTMIAYRDSSLPPETIASRVHADIVVTGTLQFLGDTTHQTVQLTGSRDNRTVWAHTFDGTRRDLLRMQGDVARELTRQIRGSADAASESAGGHQTSAEAVDLYIQGRHWLNKPTGPNLLKAIDFFERALDADADFPLAYSGIADAYVRLGYGSWLAPNDAFPKAEAAADSALRLDSTLAAPHATLGFVEMYYRWDWPIAEREFKRSLELNRSYATGHEWYGLFLVAMGRFDDALTHERAARGLDPLSTPIAGTTAWVLHYARRQDDAQRELQIALRVDPTFSLGHFYLGRVYQARGKLDSALSEFASTGPLHTWIPSIAGEGYVYGLLGRRQDALAALARMDSLSHSEYVTAYAMALVHASLGNRDSAFAWLERGVKERTHWLVWLNRDLRWEPLRSDPRFAVLVREIHLPP